MICKHQVRAVCPSTRIFVRSMFLVRFRYFLPIFCVAVVKCSFFCLCCTRATSHAHAQCVLKVPSGCNMLVALNFLRHCTAKPYLAFIKTLFVNFSPLLTPVAVMSRFTTCHKEWV
ncbi:hypothetical protein VCUG_00885 [Vavraia culicis subsp. floridensis]|uniref:Uncharacterized protein n=1 Tax=Vavraia culicis (isolate floridensis) TaxID=948595 RepID=L2GW24_VAVCU|nr:uncharacterized protein VCUG_00885 [Vavraia culicis subsp. floridensis]ELA47562.1 hypothetical protein VCUG_00885 [Vavraia culicis subsp. floridensis]